jgi:methyl-accepting chemotaxis protein
MLAKLSVTHQFALLGLLGIILTFTAIGLDLNSGYESALNAKKAEIKALVDAAVSATESDAALARSGTITTAEAQRRALAALSAARFDNGNYYFTYTFDGTVIEHAKKSLLGTNRYNNKDQFGNLTNAPMLDAARNGHPIFHEYYQPKANATVPQPKISYMAPIPEWGWAIGTGLYIDDLRHQFFASLITQFEIFTPIFIGFIAVIVMMSRGVANLLAQLSNCMDRIAQGAFETQIPALRRKDALGNMAHRVAGFRDSARQKHELEAAAQAAMIQAQAERTERDAERDAIAQQQQMVTAALATGLEKLSGGDLMYRINNVFGADYEKLRHDFNDALKKLQEAMRGIAANTLGVKSGATEITSASDDLARRTEQQAASLEETAAALDQITATVRKSAEAAAEARNLAAEAKSDAERSDEVVRDTVNAMSGIASSSKQIGNIIGVIDEIAFQTNLLALNAGVEAARAGDAGRGFAVVATEVRALAQRSADAAKEIKNLISASSTQVESGVKLVGRTGQALERIVGQIAKLNSLVSDIAASAQEQSTGLSQVNIAVNQMDQVTQQNAAMVEQATAASHSMASEAQELARLVGNFQIGDMPATRLLAKPEKPAPMPAAPTHQNKPPQRHTAKPPAAFNFAPPAPTALASAGAEDWSEF